MPGSIPYEVVVLVVTHAALTIWAYYAGARHGHRYAEREILRRVCEGEDLDAE